MKLSRWVVICAVAAWGLRAQDGEPVLPEALRGQPDWPEWAVPRRIAVPASKPWLATRFSRQGAEQMRRSCGQLRYLIEQQRQSPSRPFWMWQLGTHLADLEKSQPAAAVLAALRELPADSRHTRVVRRFPTLASLQSEGTLELARVLAREGYGEEALGYLETCPQDTAFDRVRHAEILALAGERRRALVLLAQPGTDGHPERNFSYVFVPMRAVSLAHALGDAALTERLAASTLSRGMRSQRWPQWQSAWYIIHTTVEQAQDGPLPALDTLADGTYSGDCRGFIASIEVRVTLAGGRIARVEIVREREDRSWSSLSVIPQRIVQRQSPNVDAVTHATITSLAVSRATEEALRRAGP